MILAIDAGNTNIVIGGCQESGALFHERIVTDKTMTAARFADILRGFLTRHAGPYEGACVCSVAPEITGALTEGCRLAAGLEPVVVGTDVETGLTYKLTGCSDLGPDLIAGAVAAKVCYWLPAVVIDTGTATTLMAIDENSGFLGGAILPGIRASFSALFSSASMLRELPLEPPPSAIGRNTAEAIGSGAIYGYAEMIDGLCRRFANQLGRQPVFLITGGLAYRFMDCCHTRLIHDDMLVLKGIYCIYKMNRG